MTRPDSSTTRRVAILTAVFPPAGGGASLRMAKLAKFLGEAGWQVTVIRSTEVHVQLRDEHLAAELPASVSVRSVSGPFRFLGRRATSMTNAGGSSRHPFTRAVTEALKTVARGILIPDRYVGWAWRVSRLAREDLGHPDVLLTSGPPHSVHLAGATLARKLGIPLVVDLRDDWAQTHTGRRRAPWRRPIESRMEAWAFRRASAVVHVSDASVELLSRRYPAGSERFVAIPNGFDPDDLADLPARSPRTTGPIRFVYAGSLQGTQDLGRFPEVFGALARRRPESLHVLFLGLIEDGFVRHLRTAIGPGDLAISPAVVHRDAMQVMADSDVLVVFTGGGGAGANTMTGKLFEYLALRRPILLVGPEGPAAQLVRGAGAGVTVEQRDARSLDAAITRAAELAASPEFQGASEALLDQFSRRRQAETWARLLDSAVERSRS